MKTLRAIVILLVSLAVPYSAMATMLDTLPCHHDGLGALLEASTPAGGRPCAHHDTMRTHGPLAGAIKAADRGCDCAVKCKCQHHAASGAVLLVQAFHRLPGYSRGSTDAAPVSVFTPGALIQQRFRPPIAVLPGAV